MTVELLLNVKQKKWITAIVLFISDILLSIWFYFRASNYNDYVKYISQINNSPDFQVQLYQVYMQSLIFALFLFLFAHLIIYIFFLRDFKGSRTYLRIYCIFTALGCVLLTFTEAPYLFLLALIYGAGFVVIKQISALTTESPQT